MIFAMHDPLSVAIVAVGTYLYQKNKAIKE